MSSVTLLIVIVVVVVVVAALAVVAFLALRKRQSARLREQFGPEYDRAVRGADDPNEAEAELPRREKRHAGLQLRQLEPGERENYRNHWEQVQRGFVDDPGRAVEDADRLVVDVMSARGYPVDDFDRRAEDLSVAYPVVTQHYREAREISRAHRAGTTDTEDLRHAVTSYRKLVHALLDDTDEAGHDRGPGDRRGDDRRSDGRHSDDRRGGDPQQDDRRAGGPADEDRRDGRHAAAGPDRSQPADTRTNSAGPDDDRPRRETTT